MSTTLSYGIIKPANGEKGQWFDQLNSNFQKQNDHDHDGLNSAPIPTKSLNKNVQSVTAAGWAAVAGQAGTYSQVVTVPSGYGMSTAVMRFLVDGGAEDGFEFYPTVAKASATSFTIYVNDNTLAFKVLYA